MVLTMSVVVNSNAPVTDGKPVYKFVKIFFFFGATGLSIGSSYHLEYNTLL